MDSSPKKSGPPLLRLGHPMAFTAFLSHVGAPVDRYLRRQKLPVLCDDPDMFVPLTRAWAFFDSTARSEDPAVGSERPPRQRLPAGRGGLGAVAALS